MRCIFLALALLSGTMAWAECPPSPDHSSELAALFERAQSAPNQAAARVFNARMWELWSDAPDDAAQALLDSATTASRVGDYAGALETLNRLIEYCPDYAEGWNQRAFVYFLSEDYDAALPDLERADALNPKHLGVLTGVALTLIALGRDDEAQPWLERAVALNPWISERALLKDKEGIEL